MKPIQQQLSVALGDKDPSAETQLVKQVGYTPLLPFMLIIEKRRKREIHADIVHLLDDKDDFGKNLV